MTIQLKRTTAGTVPAASSLLAGEIVLDLKNDVVYYTNGAGSLITMPFDPANLTSLLATLAVRYDVAQSLTAAQLAQFATNAGVLLRFDTKQTLSIIQKTLARYNSSAAPFDALAERNMVVNPRHIFQQFSGTAGYIDDGHILGLASGLGVTAARVASPFTTRPDLPFGLRATVNTAKATLASTDYAILQIPIEGIRTRRLLMGTSNAKNVFIGVTVNASVGGIYYFCLKNAAGNRTNYIKVALATGIDTFVPLIFSGDTAGVWINDTSGVGLSINVVMAAGSGVAGPIANAGAWQGASYWAGTDQINMLATANATLTISDEIALDTLIPYGTDPTIIVPTDRLPFFQRFDDEELRICQRYYQLGHSPSLAFAGYASGANGYCEMGGTLFTAQMRPTPSSSYTVTSNTNVYSFNVTPSVSGYRIAGSAAAAGMFYISANNLVFDARL